MDRAISAANLDTTTSQRAAVGTTDESKMTDYDERNLIINYVPANMSQEELRLLFAQVGPVDSAKLVRDKATGQSLCYGFVKFKAPQDAHKAVQFLNGQFVGPKKLKVSIARPSSPQIKDANLYVSGFPKTFSVYDFCDLFMAFGEIITCRILHDNLGRSRGVGFVRMDTHKNAERAIIELSGMKFQGLRDRLNVKFANPNGSSSLAAGITHLPSSHGFPGNHQASSVAMGGAACKQTPQDDASSAKNCYVSEGVVTGAGTGAGGTMSCNKKRPSTDEKTCQPPGNKQKVAKLPPPSPLCRVPGCVNPNCMYGYSSTPFVAAAGTDHNPVTAWCQMQQIHFTALSIALQQQAVTAAGASDHFLKRSSTPSFNNTTATLPMPHDDFGGATSTVGGTWGSSGGYGESCSSATTATGNRLRAFHNMSYKHRKRNNGGGHGGQREREEESPAAAEALHFRTISRGGASGTVSVQRNMADKCCSKLDKQKAMEQERVDDEQKTRTDKKLAVITSGRDSILGNLIWEKNAEELTQSKDARDGEFFTVTEDYEKTVEKEDGIESSESMVELFCEKGENISKDVKTSLDLSSQLHDFNVQDASKSPESVFVESEGWFEQQQNCSLNSTAAVPLISAMECPLNNVSVRPVEALAAAEGASNIYSLTSAHFSAEQLSFPLSADTFPELIPPHLIAPSATSPLVTSSLPQLNPATVSNVFSTSAAPTPALTDLSSPSPLSPFSYPYNTYWPSSTCFANDTRTVTGEAAFDISNTPGYSANSHQLVGGVERSTLPFSIGSASPTVQSLLPHVPLGGAASLLQCGATGSEFYVLIRNVPLSAPDSLLASLLCTQTNNLKSFNRNNTQCKLLFSTIQDALLSVHLLNGKKFCGNVLEATIASRPTPYMAALTNVSQNAFATARHPIFGAYAAIPFAV